MMYIKLVLFVTFLVLLILLPDKINGKNKKIWKIVLAILTAAASLSFLY